MPNYFIAKKNIYEKTKILYQIQYQKNIRDFFL